ncbi:MAG TPA: HDOD domain-containing protein [Rhodocyclaceae bacterium]
MEGTLDQEFVRNLALPPRPEIVAVLFEEMSRDEPNLTRVARKISADVALAAAMLKTVNSPAFGLARKLSSVPQAIDFLGMRQVAGIATGLAIRHSLSGGAAASHARFWDTAEKTALMCATFARRLRGIPADEAYTFGLFHDCGIPVLMRRFPRYEAALARANADSAQGFYEIEQAEVGTHHGVVGYYLTRSWQLPDSFCRAVLWHHDIEVFHDASLDGRVRDFVGIIHLAEHILDQAVRDGGAEWDRFRGPVLAHFGLSDEDVGSLADAAHEALAG